MHYVVTQSCQFRGTISFDPQKRQPVVAPANMAEMQRSC